jgi:hypothetical protein
MHQQSSALNFTFSCLLRLIILLTSKVFTKVTIGMGDVIHMLKAFAREVSLGFISVLLII